LLTRHPQLAEPTETATAPAAEPAATEAVPQPKPEESAAVKEEAKEEAPGMYSELILKIIVQDVWLMLPM
jgi:hypothetical protein